MIYELQHFEFGVGAWLVESKTWESSCKLINVQG